MQPIHKLDDRCAVCGQLSLDDLPEVARLGFVTIINNRPDGEQPGQPTAAQGQATAEAAGLAYRHIPVSPQTLGPDTVEAFRDALDTAPGPVLAHCASGTRCALLWALVQVRFEGRSVDDALATTAGAGYPFAHLRPMIESFAS